MGNLPHLIRVFRTDIPLASAVQPCTAVGRLEYFIIHMMWGADLSSEHNDTQMHQFSHNVKSLVPDGITNVHRQEESYHYQTITCCSLSIELLHPTVRCESPIVHLLCKPTLQLSPQLLEIILDHPKIVEQGIRTSCVPLDVQQQHV
jgi:hypothetical protein